MKTLLLFSVATVTVVILGILLFNKECPPTPTGERWCNLIQKSRSGRITGAAKGETPNKERRPPEVCSGASPCPVPSPDFVRTRGTRPIHYREYRQDPGPVLTDAGTPPQRIFPVRSPARDGQIGLTYILSFSTFTAGVMA